MAPKNSRQRHNNPVAQQLVRARGAYLGLAIGDALGATTEFLTVNEIKQQLGVHKNIVGGGWLKLAAGHVTDDTQMTLALGQALIEFGGFDTVAVARAFSDWMRTKPVDIGHTVRRGLMHFRTTGQTEMLENDNAAGNGACMRCLPIALAFHQQSLRQVQEYSRAQAHITHNNRDSDAACEAILAMVIAALHGEDIYHLQLISEKLALVQPQFNFFGKIELNPSGWIVHTLRAVFQAFFSYTNFEDILVDVVNRGGDADTTGAIVGMLAGAYYGEEAIPKRWIAALDPMIYRRCCYQAQALLNLIG